MWTTVALTSFAPCRLLPRDFAQFHDGHVLNAGTKVRALNLTGFRIRPGDTVSVDHVTLPRGRRIPVIVAREPRPRDEVCATCKAKACQHRRDGSPLDLLIAG